MPAAKSSSPKVQSAKKSTPKKAQNKTTQTELSVANFLGGLADAQQCADAEVLIAMMSRVSGEPPKMWGTSIIGFGTHHYVYESGREGDAPIIAFSPRKQAMTLYLKCYREQDIAAWNTLFTQLGKHTMGKGCLYIKKLADVDCTVVEKIVALAYHDIMAK